jgi:predicted HTH transcriptional regulator
LPEPKFEFAPTTFSVHFQIRNNNAVAGQDIYSANQGGIKDGINGGINSGINGGISEARQKIISLMKAEPCINTQQIADALGIGIRAAESHVRALKGAGLVQREGAKKKGAWVVAPSVPGGINDGINSGINGEINGGINSGINGGISGARQNALDLMRAGPRINTQQIADALGIGIRAAESHVRALKEAGLVRRDGARKNGRWIVKLP